MKSVLLPIHPEWCEKIASGEKTIEVRKTKPKLATPFKCYIYCTKPIGKIIGEFVCDKIENIEIRHFTVFGHENRYAAVGGNPDYQWLKHSCLSYDEVVSYGKLAPLYGWRISDLIIYDKPRELGEFWSYNENWHKAYDKQDYVNIPFCAIGPVDGDHWDGCPEETWDGKGIPPCYKCWEEWNGWCHRLTSPPQSWCYVESPPYSGGECL